MSRDTPLKDAYDTAYIERLARALGSACAGVQPEAFTRAIFATGWETLELKGRMHRIAATLDEMLPVDFKQALIQLDPVVPQFDSFHAMFFPDFVERRVMRDVDARWAAAVSALARYTPHSSSEFAVRPLLVADQPRMLAEMLAWTGHADPHVRRLATEGCRPRLPWAMALPALKTDPTPMLPILEALRSDASEYVRRSVANNLNDVAKDHPTIVLQIAARWLAEAPKDKHRSRLVKHACRTLLKAGNPEAMRLFGFRDPADLRVADLTLTADPIRIGGVLEFQFKLEGTPHLGRVRLEYAVHFRKARGHLSPKVFRISEFDTDAATRHVTRRHAFRDLSTRRHHPGRHELEIRVNGVERARAAFDVER